ncbi:DUF2726 domain-containing protein [Burkholderia gladioli]|uniref:DUF2726 domain-containing protein n=1 Tax=Burkholderia gladioli (strain BSR3) TaxID=999541 RepID=F2LSC9_BURGS|nr:DUF2726 domain-containing protein [Burkholderia gladioli]AEA65725.1 hypothetical protein bgla_3p0240 [Burkholderia gladioli BSR3]
MSDMLHNPYFPALVVALVFLAAIAAKPTVKKARRAAWSASDGPEFKCQGILTDTETRFFWQLTRALPNEWIFPQVAMSAVLQPTVPNGDRNWWRSFGKIAQKRIDFIIYDRNLNLLAVIELDDPSHDSKKANDRLRDQNLADAGIRTIRFDVRAWPDHRAIQNAVFPKHLVASVPVRGSASNMPAESANNSTNVNSEAGAGHAPAQLPTEEKA